LPVEMHLPIFVTCAMAATLSAVTAAQCTPENVPSASILEGMVTKEMQYDVSASSEGVFPFTKDHSGCAGMPASQCNGDFGGPFKQMCPELCQQPNDDPMRNVFVVFPDGTGPFPLFVYFTGTSVCNRNPAPLQMLKAMAMRGFVSASIEYPQGQSYCSFNFHDKAKAITNGAASPMGMLCALPEVDCSLGIATAGYSQGAILATLVPKYEPRVTASFAIAGHLITRELCESVPWIGSVSEANAVNADLGDLAHLPKNKRRYVIIDLDVDNKDDTGTPSGAAALQKLKAATGSDCGDEYACLQGDGSGYFVINHADIPPFPDWFPTYGLGWHEHIIDFEVSPGEWQSWFLNGPQPWTINNNLDWLCSAAKVNADDGGCQVSPPAPTGSGSTTSDAPTASGSTSDAPTTGVIMILSAVAVGLMPSS